VPRDSATLTNGTILLAPSSHLLLHEQGSAERLHHLRVVKVGEFHEPMSVADARAAIAQVAPEET
jgi:hypothetical protein